MFWILVIPALLVTIPISAQGQSGQLLDALESDISVNHFNNVVLDWTTTITNSTLNAIDSPIYDATGTPPSKPAIYLDGDDDVIARNDWVTDGQTSFLVGVTFRPELVNSESRILSAEGTEGWAVTLPDENSLRLRLDNNFITLGNLPDLRGKWWNAVFAWNSLGAGNGFEFGVYLFDSEGAFIGKTEGAFNEPPGSDTDHGELPRSNEGFSIGRSRLSSANFYYGVIASIRHYQYGSVSASRLAREMAMKYTANPNPMPQTLTVTNTDDAGEGSLRDAIAKSVDHLGDDTITFHPSLYGQTINLTSGQLFVEDSLGGTLSINCDPTSSGITIDGGGNDRIFQFGTPGSADGGSYDTSVFVTGPLTVQNGRPAAGEDGGGILTYVPVTLRNVKILANGTSDSAAVSPGAGGGIASHADVLSLFQCTVDSNSTGTMVGVSAKGGGVYMKTGNDPSTLRVFGSTISRNNTGSGTGAEGGGIYSEVKTLEIVNSTVHSNSTGGGSWGGGVHDNFANSQISIVQSTISGNSAPVGGGLYSDSGAITPKNSIVAGNQSGASNNLISQNGAITGGFVNFIDGDPGLAPFGNYGGMNEVAPPYLGNAAIVDQGRAADLPSDEWDLDQDAVTNEPLPVDNRGIGFPRVVGIAPDLGASEAISLPVTPETTSGPPLISAPNKVKTAKKKGKITARVASILPITMTAKANGGAKAKVRGANPFKIIVKKMKRKVTRVTLTATDSNGRSFTKVVKVKRT